jgi:hypothetical protein
MHGDVSTGISYILDSDLIDSTREINPRKEIKLITLSEVITDMLDHLKFGVPCGT